MSDTHVAKWVKVRQVLRNLMYLLVTYQCIIMYHTGSNKCGSNIVSGNFWGSGVWAQNTSPLLRFSQGWNHGQAAWGPLPSSCGMGVSHSWGPYPTCCVSCGGHHQFLEAVCMPHDLLLWSLQTWQPLQAAEGPAREFGTPVCQKQSLT